jgi:hypothetical protein
MNESRLSQLALIFIALLTLAAPPAAYVGGYFYFGARNDWFITLGPYPATSGDPPRTARLHSIDRTFENRWMATVFAPAASVESTLRGLEVSVQARNEALAVSY